RKSRAWRSDAVGGIGHNLSNGAGCSARRQLLDSEQPAVGQKGVDCPMSRRADAGLEGPAGGERTAGSDRAEASAAVLRRHKAKRRRRSATGFRVAFALKDF